MPPVCDPLLRLCKIIIEKLREEPQADHATLVAYLREVMVADPDIAVPLQTDTRLQINQEHATGFQSLIEAGGIGNIGLHLHGVDKTTLTEVVEQFLRAQLF